MKIKQISIFLENSAGRIAEVTNTLKEAGINLRAIMIADTADFGILRIITNDSEKTIKVLQEANFTTRTTDVLAVKIPDKVGSLHEVMVLFQKNNINIEYLYASFEVTEDSTVIIFKVENPDDGLKVLDKNGYSTISSF
ncbi:MAG: ACT domain-containing protein [Spirochaetaceae bacterium]|nr:ACT domain-containing protein [Spirochaetaceae bacterium]MBP5329935.1 ACT domain-containing protein [Spirochaetaceae bacterium]